MNAMNDIEDAQAGQRDEYLRVIIETTQDAFIVISEDEKIIDYNHAFLKMTGYTWTEAADLILDDIVPPNHWDDKVQNAGILREKGTKLIDGAVKKKDGGLVDAEISATMYSAHPFIVVCFIRDISDRKSTAKSLLQMHDLMKYIIEHNRSAVAIHDKELRYMYVSRPYMEFFKVKDPDIINKHHYDVFPDLPQRLRDVHERVLKGEIVSCDEEEYHYPDGSTNWMRWECRPWYENDGCIGGFVLYTEIITERKLMEQALFNEKEHFKTALLSVGDGVISTDKNGIITVMNPLAEKLTGWTYAKALGKPIAHIIDLYREDTGKPYDVHLKLVMGAGKIVETPNNIIMVSKSGAEIPVELSAAPIKGRSGEIAGAVIVIRDFTEKRAKQKQIEYLSYNDYVTGLYNRRYMENAFSQLDSKKNLPLTLMVIDVNGLKLTNDAFGHKMGDQLLKQVAKLLKKACRAGDIVGRMGGDEFCIILPNTDEIHAEMISSRIKAAAAQVRFEPIIVSLAVGYAVKRTSKQDIKSVMTTADNMMYKDKIKYGRTARGQTIDMILNSINLNYSQEQIHTERVSQFCEQIACALNMSEKEVRDIKTAGALHDIGKIMVPPQLLNKVEKLTDEEFDIIKRHPEIGYQMLKSVDEYAHLSEDVLFHHERYDGAGYPEGLTGENIPLYARIIAVADAFEAMTAPRPYQKIKTKEAALAELKRCAGTQFDPVLVDVFVNQVISKTPGST